MQPDTHSLKKRNYTNACYITTINKTKSLILTKFWLIDEVTSQLYRFESVNKKLTKKKQSE